MAAVAGLAYVLRFADPGTLARVLAQERLAISTLNQIAFAGSDAGILKKTAGPLPLFPADLSADLLRSLSCKGPAAARAVSQTQFGFAISNHTQSVLATSDCVILQRAAGALTLAAAGRRRNADGVCLGAVPR